MADTYRRIYDVGLLDDLHNYFPGLLYEPDRFRTVSDVLAYVRETASRRFNLFDYGARQYEQTRIPQNTFRSTPINRRAEVPIVETHEFDLSNDIDLSILIPLMRNIDRLRTPTLNENIRATGSGRLASLFQDIIVHASQELIDSASSIRTLETDLEGSCSICQDRMRQGENIRRLNACQHEFHGECVDNWFLERSVLCPVCRHDIRDPATPSEENSIPLTPRSNINSMFNRRLE